MALVKALLVKNPQNRLGGRNGPEEMKQFAFFAAFDWEALFNKKIPMPYIPELSNNLDLSSFETQFTRLVLNNSFHDSMEKKFSHDFVFTEKLPSIVLSLRMVMIQMDH